MVDISVVIPTYNRFKQIQKLIAVLEDQSYPKDRYEVIVVSDGGRDGTYEYLQSASPGYALRPVFQANAGAAEARNTGAKNAQGDLLLFLDDDIFPDPDLIATHVRSHAGAQPGDMIVGPMLTPTDWQMLPWVAWEQAMLERQYSAMTRGRWKPTARQFYTGNASLRRDFFFANDCFDSQFRRAEDVEFAYRAMNNGGRIVFNPEARAYHYAERSFNSWINTAYAYGCNDVTFTQVKGITWLLPVILSEFQHRNILVRGILRLYLDKQPEQAELVRKLETLGEWVYRKKLFKISQIVFSGIFNLRYYQGIADELGGRDKFYALAKRR